MLPNLFSVSTRKNFRVHYPFVLGLAISLAFVRGSRVLLR